MNEVQAQKEAGTYVQPSKLTVREYLERWLAGGAGGHLRATTLKTYEVAVRVHLVPRIGDVPLQRLDTATVKAMYRNLRATGYAKHDGPERRDHLEHIAARYRALEEARPRSAVKTLVAEHGRPESTIRSWVRRCRTLGLLDEASAPPATEVRGLSPKAVHNVHLALVKALNDAVEDGLLRTNPAARAHRLGTGAGPEMSTWSAGELRRFLELTHGDRHGAMWRLAAQTGMRRGEVLGLRWRDVDLERGRLSVRQQLVRNGDAIGFGPPKTTAGRRMITLDPGTVASMLSHRAAQREARQHWGAQHQDQDLAFCRPDGEPHDPDVITHQFESAIANAGVPRIRLHDLRHTHATLLLQANVHPKVVQERLGHSSIKVTIDRYSHVIPNMQDEAAARIGALVDGLESDPTADTLPPDPASSRRGAERDRGAPAT
jgi:integrase